MPGPGRSNIRRWIIENDWLDAIVALPDQLFYNTGISTYVWLVTNRKPPERRGKVQLIDGTRFFQRMKKSLNNKRNEITDEQIRHLIPVSGSGDGSGQPGKAGERAQPSGLGEERVPGGAGGVHHGLVAAGEDAVAEPAVAQVLPHPLDRVELGAVGRQVDQGQVRPARSGPR